MIETLQNSVDQDVRLRALIVDDHLLLSETLASVLDRDAIEAEYVCSVDDAYDRITEQGRYDAVLLDYDMPGMNGLSGLRRLIEANHGAVALFSGVANWLVVERAIEAGASGFIPKTLPRKTLGHAIRLISDGDIYLPAEFMLRDTRGDDKGTGLRPREMRVLGFLCEGMQNKEIGRELGIEETIVKMDVKSICKKLGVRNRTEAVIAALKKELF